MKGVHHAIFGCLCSVAFALSESLHGDFQPTDDAFCSRDNCDIKREIIIDESLNQLSQDDPQLIKILKEKYLVPPSEEEYNLPINSDEWDVYMHEEDKAYPVSFGQYGQPRAIDK